MPHLSRSLNDLDLSDFNALVASGQDENEQLEFKEDLPAKGGRDIWHTEQDAIGDYGRNRVLAEVVAMANSYGGDVVIGIAESMDKPHRAIALKPLPKCIELAHRLAQQASSCIEPQIPSLQTRGFPIGDGSAGLVIIRMPKSRLAPHRLIPTKECYHRVRDNTEAMAMRQIQDLTFSVVRGLESIDSRFRSMLSEFNVLVERNPLQPDLMCCGYSIVAVPVSTDIDLGRVHGETVIRPLTQRRIAGLNGTRVELAGITDIYNWRPVLRGTRARHEHGRDRVDIVSLFADGTIQYVWRGHVRASEVQAGDRPRHVLYPGWLFCDVLNALESIERIRVQANAGGVEYALEVALFTSHELPILRMNSQWHDVAGNVTPGLIQYPRYVVGPASDLDDVATLIWHDFWNSIGIEAEKDRLTLKVPPAQSL